MCDFGHDSTIYDLVTKASARPNGRNLRRREKRLERIVQGHLDEQAEFIARKAKPLFNGKALGDDIDKIFDDLDDSILIEDILTEASAAMLFGATYRIRKNRLGTLGIAFDLGHPDAVQYLEQQRPLVLSKMKQTTKDEIKPLLIEAAKTGESPNSVAKKIGEAFSFSKSRSIMIAVNEIGTAYEYGNWVPMVDAQKQGHEVLKGWLTVGDNRVTPQCKDYQTMGFIPLDDNFVSGTGTTDQTAPRASNPRCRCTTLYEVDPN